MFKPNNKILSTFWDQQQDLCDYDDVMEEYISNNPNSLINEVTYSKAKERISPSSCKSRHYEKQQNNIDFYTHGDKTTLYLKNKNETMNNEEWSLGSTTPVSIKSLCNKKFEFNRSPIRKVRDVGIFQNGECALGKWSSNYIKTHKNEDKKKKKHLVLNSSVSSILKVNNTIKSGCFSGLAKRKTHAKNQINSRANIKYSSKYQSNIIQESENHFVTMNEVCKE